MKRHKLYILIAIWFFSFRISYGQIHWVEKNGIDLTQVASDLPENRSDAIAFYLNGNIYYGLGQTTFNILQPIFHNTTFTFNPTNNLWSFSSTAPFQGRLHPGSFTIQGKQYVVGGKNYRTQTAYFDCWEYDPSTNYWVQKSNFPGHCVWYACSFSSYDKGYIVCGEDSSSNTLNEVWQYDPTSDTWLQLSDFPGLPRIDSKGTSINNLGYLAGGFAAGNNLQDLWQYNAMTDTWTQLSSVPLSGSILYAFSLNGYSYFGSYQGGARYNPIDSSWSGHTTHPLNLRTSSIVTSEDSGFAIEGSAVYYYNSIIDQWDRLYISRDSIPSSLFYPVQIDSLIYFNDRRYNTIDDTWEEDSLFFGSFEKFNISNNVYTFKNNEWKAYDIATQTWRNLAAYPGQGYAVSFLLYDTIYFGISELNAEVWGYSIQSDTWQLSASFPGTLRSSTHCFVVDNQAYVCGGVNFDSSIYLNDLWAFDPLTQNWSVRSNVPISSIYNGFSVGTNRYGYVGLGMDFPQGNQHGSEIYEYDPINDTWQTYFSNPVGGRTNPASFCYNNLIYILGGYNRLVAADRIPLIDNWCFLPNKSLELEIDVDTICASANDIVVNQVSPFGGTITGAGVNDSIFSPSAAGPGVHVISYVYTFNQQDYSVTDTITVLPNPNLSIGNDTSLCYGSSIILSPTQQFASYSWSDGSSNETLAADSTNLSLGLNYLSLTVEDSLGCIATDTIAILYDPCSSIQENNSSKYFTVYPNPAIENVTIRSNPGSMIHLTTLDGKLKLATEQNVTGETNLRLTEAGCYFVTVYDHMNIKSKLLLVLEQP